MDFLKKGLGAALAVVLSTQALFAELSQSNLWEDRRAAHAQHKPVQVAALPFALPAISATISSAERPLSPRLAKLPSALSTPLSVLPTDRVTIGETHEAGQRPPVVILQDIHLNPEAQKNIQATVAALMESRQMGSLHLEGGFGKLDFAPFRLFSEDTRRKLADALIDARILGGPSAAALTASQIPDIEGADDEQAYAKNVQAIRDAAVLRPAVQQALVALRRDIDSRKPSVYGEKMKAYDRLAVGYRAQTRSFGEHLASLVSLGLQPNADADTFLAAHRLERSLNFPRVEAERRAVVEKLVRTLTPAEIASLTQEGIAFRSGQLGFADFYRSLERLCAKHDVSLAATPAFRDYLRYVLLADKIEAGRLLAWADRAEEMFVDRLAATPEEKKLARLDRAAVTAERLCKFELTPSEWDHWTRVGPALPQPLKTQLSAFEDFYHEADVRTDSLVASVTRGDDRRLRVLVVGGFHTPLLTKKLKDLGVPYAVASPRLTKTDGASSAYLDVFTREKTPLEKIFAGEKLTINPTTAIPTPFNTTGQNLRARGAVLDFPRVPAGMTVTEDGGVFTVTDSVVPGPSYTLTTGEVPPGWEAAEPVSAEGTRFVTHSAATGVFQYFTPGFWASVFGPAIPRLSKLIVKLQSPKSGGGAVDTGRAMRIAGLVILIIGGLLEGANSGLLASLLANPAFPEAQVMFAFLAINLVHLAGVLRWNRTRQAYEVVRMPLPREMQRLFVGSLIASSLVLALSIVYQAFFGTGSEEVALSSALALWAAGVGVSVAIFGGSLVVGRKSAAREGRREPPGERNFTALFLSAMVVASIPFTLGVILTGMGFSRPAVILTTALTHAMLDGVLALIIPERAGLPAVSLFPRRWRHALANWIYPELQEAAANAKSRRDESVRDYYENPKTGLMSRDAYEQIMWPLYRADPEFLPSLVKSIYDAQVKRGKVTMRVVKGQAPLPWGEDTRYIMFDANNFTKVNNLSKRGWAEGDDQIQAIAMALRLAQRQFPDAHALPFHNGGDEFSLAVHKDVAEEMLTFVLNAFGVREYEYSKPDGTKDTFRISLTGGIGKDFDEADKDQARRKDNRKDGIEALYADRTSEKFRAHDAANKAAIQLIDDELKKREERGERGLALRPYQNLREAFRSWIARMLYPEWATRLRRAAQSTAYYTKMATIDQKTGAMNQRALDIREKRNLNPSNPYTVIVDIKFFGQINKYHQRRYDAGNEEILRFGLAIREAVEAVRERFRNVDFYHGRGPTHVVFLPTLEARLAFEDAVRASFAVAYANPWRQVNRENFADEPTEEFDLELEMTSGNTWQEAQSKLEIEKKAEKRDPYRPIQKPALTGTMGSILDRLIVRFLGVNHPLYVFYTTVLINWETALFLPLGALAVLDHGVFTAPLLGLVFSYFFARAHPGRTSSERRKLFVLGLLMSAAIITGALTGQKDLGFLAASVIHTLNNVRAWLALRVEARGVNNIRAFSGSESELVDLLSSLPLDLNVANLDRAQFYATASIILNQNLRRARELGLVSYQGSLKEAQGLAVQLRKIFTGENDEDLTLEAVAVLENRLNAEAEAAPNLSPMRVTMRFLGETDIHRAWEEADWARIEKGKEHQVVVYKGDAAALQRLMRDDAIVLQWKDGMTMSDLQAELARRMDAKSAAELETALFRLVMSQNIALPNSFMDGLDLKRYQVYVIINKILALQVNPASLEDGFALARKVLINA